jgi:hypothetical protein
MSEVQEKKYSLTKEQSMYYSSVLVLEDMCNFGKTFPLVLDGDDELLEPLFVHMGSKGWVEALDTQYKPTEEGRKVLKNYLDKLEEFRAIFKVYCSVDIETDEIGYEKYFDFDTDEQFADYVNQEHWEDLRVAVCEMKGINPLDVIFLEFVDGGEFDFEQENWQADLVTGLIWDNMLEVANSNLHIEDFDEYDEDDELVVDGEKRLEKIIKDGTNIMLKLIKKQAEIDAEEEDTSDEEYEVTEYEVEEPTFEVTHYEVYQDPYYMSPCWGVRYY